MLQTNSVKLISVEPLEESKYIKPKKVIYQEGDRVKSWDVVEVHDSVATLLYHVKREELLLVKQLRPAVFLKNNNGYTYELCAGILDKGVDSLLTAKEEIEEETGFDVPLHSIKKITEFYTAVGFAGSRQELFFAEIDDSMKRHEGGGIETEDIEPVYIKKEELKEFIFDSSKVKTPGLMFAACWFLHNY